MERTQLLSDLVELDTKIIEATKQAGLATNDTAFEKLISDVKMLRVQRAEIQAKLDSLPPLPQLRPL